MSIMCKNNNSNPTSSMIPLEATYSRLTPSIEMAREAVMKSEPVLTK